MAREQSLRLSDTIVPQKNRYYLRVSRRWRMVGWLFAVALGMFLVVTLSVYGKYITYDNLTYLARDFDLSVRTTDDVHTTVTYPRQEKLAFAPFKSGMAVLGADVLRLYDGAGISLLEDKLGYTTPALCTSEKYVLCYDLGAKQYSVYNALTRVIRRDTDFRILCADMSDSGAYLLVTRSNETRYVVEYYNEALSRTMSVYKDHYVLDAAIRDDGARFVICSAIPSGTDLSCEISLCQAGSAEPVRTTTYPGAMPLMVDFAPDGSFTVVCDTMVLTCGADGEEIARYPISGMTLVTAHQKNGVTAIAAAENALGSENRIVVLDAAGTILLDTLCRQRVTDITVCGGKTYCAVLTPNAVLTLDGAGVLDTIPVDDDDVLSLEYAGTRVLICSKDRYYVPQGELQSEN